MAGDGAAETEQATGGSDGDKIAAKVEEIAAVEVFPAVLGGVVNEGRGIGMVIDHEEPRISSRDLGASKLEALRGLA